MNGFQDRANGGQRSGRRDECEFTGRLTQSDVSATFLIRVPLYMEFDGKPMRVADIAINGSTTREFKLRLPKKPMRVLLNVNDDVLASETVVKEM